MGWTYYRARFQKKQGKSWVIDRKAEVEQEFFLMPNSSLELVKGALVGSVYYAAVRKKGQTDVYGLVILTSAKDGEFGYKDMSEFCHPFYYDCPVSILKALTPTDSEQANEWRKNCLEKLQKKKEAKKNLTSMQYLPIGTEVRIDLGNQVIEAVKVDPAYQFKRPWWFIPATNQALNNVKRFDGKFTIVTLGNEKGRKYYDTFR